MITDAIALKNASRRDIPTAVMIAELWNRALYHFKENSVQTVTILDALNEYTTSVMIGRYKNISVKVIMMTLASRDLVSFLK